MTTHATYSQERTLFAILSEVEGEPYVLGLGDSFLRAVREAREHAEDAGLPSEVFDSVFLVVRTSPAETYQFQKSGREVSKDWICRQELVTSTARLSC